MNKFSTQHIIKLVVTLLCLVLLFHFSILAQLIPYKIVWGGKLNSVEEMYGFELISITINLLILIVVCLKGQFIRNSISTKVINSFLWLFFVIFSLNTIGNLFAESNIEKIIFTPITLILSISFWLILNPKKNNLN